MYRPSIAGTELEASSSALPRASRALIARGPNAHRASVGVVAGDLGKLRKALHDGDRALRIAKKAGAARLQVSPPPVRARRTATNRRWCAKENQHTAPLLAPSRGPKNASSSGEPDRMSLLAARGGMRARGHAPALPPRGQNQTPK
jgi:hypothetical protein